MEDACCCFTVGTNTRAHTVNPTQNPAPPIRTSLRFVFIVCWTDKTPVCSLSLTPELSDAGGPARPPCQLTWPARVRSSDFVSPRAYATNFNAHTLDF